MNIWPYGAPGREAFVGESFRFEDWRIEVDRNLKTASPSELSIRLVRTPDGSRVRLGDDHSFVADKPGAYLFEISYLGRTPMKKRVICFHPDVLQRADLQVRYGSPPNRERIICRGIASDTMRFPNSAIEYSMEVMGYLLPMNPANNERGQIDCVPNQYCE